MSVAKKAEQDAEVAQLVADAEALAAGKKPGDAPPSPPPGSAGPVAGDPGDGPASPPAPMDPGPLADLAVILGDMLFAGLLGFGEAGRLAEPLRAEAVKAWGDVIRQYAPALQTVGPAGALLTIYGIHFATLTAGQAWAQQAAAGGSAPGPSGETGPAKQP